MKSKGKYIGLNQRIPFEVLDSAIHFYLTNGTVEKDFVFQRMLEFTKGENRANKASNYVIQIIKRQSHLLIQLRKELKDVDYSSLSTDNRKSICLCLICLTYPIAYDLLIALAQGFKVQPQISKQFINEKVKTIYGSNRTVDVAIDALLPMIIELNTINRVKMSLYSISDKLTVTNKFVAELIIYTDIKLTGSKSCLIEDLSVRPWYLYFVISDLTIYNYSTLIVKKDSEIGRGYFTIVSR